MASPLKDETLFDDDERLITRAKEYLELREKLKREAKQDPQRTPTPSLLAKELNLTIEELNELADFADNHLGDFEREYILSRNPTFLDMKTGKPLQPSH